MQIHNGDHLEFELEHATTKPEERPDWPLPSYDPRDWAKAFSAKNPAVAADDAMPWFACALQRGYDEATERAVKLREEDDKTIRLYKRLTWLLNCVVWLGIIVGCLV